MSSLPRLTALPPLARDPPGRPVPGTADLLRAPWPWRRTRERSKLRRRASRDRAIVLGNASRPWHPDAASAAVLESLAGFRGLEIRITTCSPRLLDSLPVLTALDRDHAVDVDVVVAGPDLRAGGVRDGLEVVRRLAAEGITTRVLVGAAELAGADPRRFFAAVRGAGAADVRTTCRRRDLDAQARFERLRLQHGFPRAPVGRG